MRMSDNQRTIDKKFLLPIDVMTEENACVEKALAADHILHGKEEKEETVVTVNPKELLKNKEVVKRLLAVAGKYSSEAIINNILTTCDLFDVKDVNHIAYILATIIGESSLGKEMMEKTPHLLQYNWYEPVFDKNNNLIEETSSLDITLKAAIEILSDGIIKLTKLFKNEPVSEKELHGFISSIAKFLNKQQCMKDKELLASIEEINNTGSDVVKQKKSFLLVSNKLSTGLMHLIKDKNLNDVIDKINSGQLLKALDSTKLLEEWLCKISNLLSSKNINKLYDELKKCDMTKPPPEQLDFYKVQVQLIVIAWLILRIHKAQFLGNNKEKDGDLFKGRGYVQVTGRGNYTKYTKKFKDNDSKYHKALIALGEKQMPDLVNNPKLAENSIISLPITVGGMIDGLFTGKKLSQCGAGKNFDFFKARSVVNGKENKDKNGHYPTTEKIAKYAEKYRLALTM